MNTEHHKGTLFLTVAETAQELRCTPRHVYNMLEAGRLRSVKLGRSRRVVAASVHELAQGEAA